MALSNENAERPSEKRWVRADHVINDGEQEPKAEEGNVWEHVAASASSSSAPTTSPATRKGASTRLTMAPLLLHLPLMREQELLRRTLRKTLTPFLTRPLTFFVPPTGIPGSLLPSGEGAGGGTPGFGSSTTPDSRSTSSTSAGVADASPTVLASSTSLTASVAATSSLPTNSTLSTSFSSPLEAVVPSSSSTTLPTSSISTSSTHKSASSDASAGPHSPIIDAGPGGEGGLDLGLHPITDPIADLLNSIGGLVGLRKPQAMRDEQGMWRRRSSVPRPLAMEGEKMRKFKRERWVPPSSSGLGQAEAREGRRGRRAVDRE
ncbi:hypothetical protein JCM11641_002197 [Rhodosporidiobolus odoratus]